MKIKIKKYRQYCHICFENYLLNMTSSIKEYNDIKQQLMEVEIKNLYLFIWTIYLIICIYLKDYLYLLEIKIEDYLNLLEKIDWNISCALQFLKYLNTTLTV